MSKSERKSRRKKRDAGELPSTEADLSEPDSMAGAHEPQVEANPVKSSPATLDADQWPALAWPENAGPRSAGFQVVIRRSALNAIHRHGRAAADIEICGVLAGNVYRDDAGSFLNIEAIVRGEFAGSANAQVTFTAETWNHIQKVMEAEHPDQKIVGWYHTHPSFGIFLSDMDLFIHGNFFNMPWQVAFVYDPVSEDEGMFLWRDGKTERGSYAVDEDVEEEIVPLPVSAEITAAALADFSRRMQNMESRQKTVMILLGLFVLAAMAWPFVLFTIMSERRIETRAIPTAAVAATHPSLALPATQPVDPIPSSTTLPATAPATSPATAPAATFPSTAPSSTQPNVSPATQP